MVFERAMPWAVHPERRPIQVAREYRNRRGCRVEGAGCALKGFVAEVCQLDALPAPARLPSYISLEENTAAPARSVLPRARRLL